MRMIHKITAIVALTACVCLCACAHKQVTSASDETVSVSESVTSVVKDEAAVSEPEEVSVEEPEEEKEEPTPEPEPEKEVVYETLTEEEAAPYLEHLSISDNETSLGNMVLTEDESYLFYFDCGENFKAEEATLQIKREKDYPQKIHVSVVFGEEELPLGRYYEAKESWFPWPKFDPRVGINLGNIPDFITNNEYECALVKGCPDDDNCLLIDFGTEIGTVKTGNICLDGGDGEYEHVPIADKPMLAVIIDNGDWGYVYATEKLLEKIPYPLLCYVGMEDGKVRWIYELFVS
ncbi:MAG: hypothetical protein IKX87_00220 [Lachnospiraceae bacterium]|nr:hypothetical protein [Lachnospiraceae bacterium]